MQVLCEIPRLNKKQHTLMLGTKPGSMRNRCPSSLVMKSFSSSYDLFIVLLSSVAQRFVL